MSGIQNFSIHFQFNPIWFWIGFVLILLYSAFVYRFTIPQVGLPFKIFLIMLRSVALTLILFAIFEPTFSYEKAKETVNKNYVFIDNSKSIAALDSAANSEIIIQVLTDFEDKVDGEKEILTFGNEIQKINIEDSDTLNFSEGISNYSEIFDFINNEESVPASVTIIGDGIITDGVNPLYNVAKLDVPVFTVGVGDTTTRKDLYVGNILYNNFIYVENETTIKTDILNSGFQGESVSIQLKEDGRFIEQKQINLNKEGYNSVEFNYLPEEPGEKKLQVEISVPSNDFNSANNQKTFFIDVLDSKVNILLISGSPSPDVSFIKNTLEQNKNFEVKNLIQFDENSFIGEYKNISSILDSSEIFVFVGFPSIVTSNELTNNILNKIESENKSLFFVLSSGADLDKLKSFQSVLPFTIRSQSESFIKVQPWSVEISDPIIKVIENPIQFWTNLPPVERSASEIIANPGSRIISKAKTNNIETEYPLILSQKINKRRSLALTAKDIWKWKLQTSNKNPAFFDNFLNAVIKWLNADEDSELIEVNPSKRLYSSGEIVQFNAQVYDESFNPLNNAEIKIKILHQNNDYEIVLSSAGDGIYEGSFETNQTGDFTYTAEVKSNEKIIGSDKGRFSIGEVEVEKLNLKMDSNFLYNLASETGGNFVFAENYSSLIPDINKVYKKTGEKRIEKTEIVLWSNEWLLMLAVFFLSLEWFLRKRSGML